MRRCAGGASAPASADVLMLPEYVSEQWLQFVPPADLAPPHEIDFTARQGAWALPCLAATAAREGIALLAGTFPAVASRRNPTGPP